MAVETKTLHSSSEQIIDLNTLYNVCSVHREMFSTSRRYHDACGGGGGKVTKAFQVNLKTPMYS